MRKTDFQAMQIMSERNLDIALCPDMISANKNKKGGKVEFGLPTEAIDKVLNGMMFGKQTHYAALYVINIDQMNAIKEEEDRSMKELEDLKNKLEYLEWVPVSKGFPICFESGNWDGVRSDLVVVETQKGLFEVARLYSGTMDGHKFNDWATADDFEVENVIQWKRLK